MQFSRRHRSGRRRRTAVLAVAAVTASALLLTACGPSSGKGHRGGGSKSKSSSTRSKSTTRKSDGTPATTAAVPDPVTTRSPGRVPRCRTKDLTMTFETGGDAVPDTASDLQQNAGIAVRNSGRSACAIGGFPGVDLTGGTVTWSLIRSSRSYSPLTLQPGRTTDFRITFLPEPGGKWTPRRVTVTPPDETTSKKLVWPWGPVLLQDGATHPGTYVGPIG